MYLFQLQTFADDKIKGNVQVLPCDLLPRSFKLPHGFIINNSNHDEIGSHWVALAIDAKRRGYYFDSYGMKPIEVIEKFIKRHCRYWSYNSRQLQQEHSDACGRYCAMFLYGFFNGIKPEQFINEFTSNLWLNDVTINDMYKRYCL